jgi:bacteriocin biosynthesis cyclodehydratase domain-containing protein
VTTPGAAAAELIGFKRHLRAEVVADEAVYLFSERGVTALQGAHLEALAPLLDGTRDLNTLLDALAGDPQGIAPEQLDRILSKLAEAGLLSRHREAPGAEDDRALAYWEASGLDAAQASTGVTAGRISLLATGAVDPAPVLEALRAAGTNVTPSTEIATGSGDLSLVLCDDYLSADLAAIDAAHRSAGRPWLLADPTGAQVWIGPVFAPDGPCWHCLSTRLWGYRQAEAHVQAALGRSGPAARPAMTLPPLGAAAAGLIALEATKWLAGYRYAGQQSIWTLDSLDLRGRLHEVRRRPQCVSCGDPGLVTAQTRRPVVLAPRKKVSQSGGGHRSKTPEETMAGFRHLISPVSGLVKEIRRDPRGPAFFNSYRSGPNLALGARHLRALRASLRVENGGKGITPLHGEVSALCEALERHSGNFHGDEYRVRGSLASLGADALNPNDCQLFHERQYPGRSAWNASHSPFQHVTDPFDENAVMDWTPVWSLTAGRQRLLPTAQLYYGAPREQGPVSVLADSNGNAAGSSLEDAVLQGLLELVERDAVALWWYNRTRQPAVDLAAFADPWITELREVYTTLHREVWVLDLTSDLGIPVMAALSRRTDKPAEDIMFGFGAHLDPAVALRRALTELNQLMPVLAEVGPDGKYECNDADAVAWWSTATVAAQPYLLPDPAAPARGPASFPALATDDLRDDVETVHRRVRELGMELLVLDQTRPDIGLPVVKVIVPGMRGFWSRFAPGRLYDVPVKLGRLAEPTRFEDLNPLPLFV